MRAFSQKVKQVAQGVQESVRSAFRGVINLVNSKSASTELRHSSQMREYSLFTFVAT